MQTFTSKVRTILHQQEDIYNTLSDLNNLSVIEDRIPRDKIKEFSYGTDFIKVKLDVVGDVTLRIVDRSAGNTIKLATEDSKSEAFLWVQLKEVAPGDTKIKLTMKTKLNAMMKMMVKNKLQKFLDDFADKLTTLDYKNISQ